jgi:hypothetical protein
VPNWGIYISIDQLGYPAASLRDVIQQVKTINRDAGLVILGTYNLALSLAAVRVGLDVATTDRLAAQQALLRNTISERRLKELRDKLGSAQLVRRPLFHRAQLLTMIKLVARYGHPTGGNRLVSRNDFDQIAELGLLVNSLWAFVDQAKDAGDVVAPILAPSIELENPPSVAESLARSTKMLGPHLADLQFRERFARQLERIFLFETRLNFTELVDLTFALWSYYSSMSVDEMISNQRRAHFNPFAPDNVVSPQNIRKLLDLVSIPFGEIPGIVGEADARNYLVDFTPFRQWPVWMFAESNYLCVDPAFLQEKLSSGVYWTVMNALDPEAREEFSRIWGRMFELQLFETLESFSLAGTVDRSPRYSDTQDEAFDAVVDFGDRLIVIQAKASFVRADAKYSGVPDLFFEGLDERFGLLPGRALGQTRSNLRYCFGLEGRRVVEEFRGRHFREILPVIVYQEPVLNFGPVTRHYARQLEEDLRGFLFQLDAVVRPVVFLHIDDFHLFAQHARDGAITFVDVLHRKLADDPGHVESFGAFWSETLRPSLGLAARRDELLAAQFRRYADESLARFGRGDYL